MKSTRQQRAWYWYDWANSAYFTTTYTVLIGPYLTSLATNAACPALPDGQQCTTNLNVLGIPVAPGSLHPYTATFATLISAVLLILVGALADRSDKPQNWLAVSAAIGATAASAMFFLEGDNWQLGVTLYVIATLSIGASLVVYDAILCRIATPDQRDAVSSKGWALGYLGGGLLLALNLALLTLHDRLGISTGMAVRISLLSAGLWWGLFTLIPYLGLRNLPRRALDADDPGPSAGTSVGAAVGQTWRQLVHTLRDLRNYPQTMWFLVAYLFYNDGIQTVIGQSSLFAQVELGMSTGQVMMVFLLIQFIAFFGALAFGRAAGSFGAKRVILAGIGIWLVVVAAAFLVPSGSFGGFVALGAAIGLVLGGTQALSRSLFSQLVPARREAEYFSLYQAMERGTSWSGTLVYGLAFQFAGSYRFSIIALVAFFLLGGLLLLRVDVRRGIHDAGNPQPKII